MSYCPTDWGDVKVLRKVKELNKAIGVKENFVPRFINKIVLERHGETFREMEWAE